MKRLIRALDKQERLDVARRVETERVDAPWELMITSRGTKRLREMYSIVALIFRMGRRETSE